MFSPSLATRMQRIGTEGAYDVLNQARALEAKGRSIIHCEIGEPDFPTPQYIQDAAMQALRDGYTHYATPQGIPLLREAVAEHISQTRGVAVDPAQVLVTPGAKPVMYFLMTALLEPGDEVILPDPAFPIYASLVNFLGAKPVPVKLREENEFRFDVDEFEAALSPKTRLAIFNSPHNPTGGVLPKCDVERLARILVNRDIMVLTDEIYCRILFEGSHHSLYSEPGMPERTVLLDGFSKAYAMTGWRLGYGVMPLQLAQTLSKVLINSVSCTATFTQVAGAAALRGDQSAVAAMTAEFRRRRDFFCDRLNQIPGFHCRRPAGAFYLFPNIRETGMSATELQNRLLQEVGVACLPGTAFGAAGEGYLRFSVANSLENLALAADQIHAWVQKQGLPLAVSRA